LSGLFGNYRITELRIERIIWELSNYRIADCAD